MAGSTFGKIFKIMTWGESHGKAIGVVIDGCPANLSLCEEDIAKELIKRRPGNNKYSSPRKEVDLPIILSGVFEGKTLGTPICIMVKNNNANSKDYSDLKDVYRPSHADYTYDKKYGIRDYNGGGRASGRETVSRVIAGSVAKKILKELGITVLAYTKSVGDILLNDNELDFNEIENNPFRMPSGKKIKLVEESLEKIMAEHDSLGGIIECRVNGLKAGIGEPVFDKLDAVLTKAIMSIPSIKGVEIGNGFACSTLKGSENNDCLYSEDGIVKKYSNNAGGIYSGISDGSEIVFRASVKPTPSIAKKQRTVNSDGENIEISIGGRHDPLIVPRACIVVESMVAISILDLILENNNSRLDKIIDMYE